MSVPGIFDPLDMHDPGHKKGDPLPNASADALAAISKKMFEETDPLRAGLIDRSQSFLDGNQDVTGTPQFLGMKNAADSQFQRARDNTIARTASGGGLVDALTGLEGDRATTLTQGAGSIAGDEMNRAFSLATGLVPSASGGLGQAAGIQGQMLASQQAEQGQAKQGAGQGAGALAAALVMK